MFSKTRQYVRVFSKASVASAKWNLHMLDCWVNKLPANEKVGGELLDANIEWINLTWGWTKRLWDCMEKRKGDSPP